MAYRSLCLTGLAISAFGQQQGKAPPQPPTFIQAIDTIKHSVVPVVCLSVAQDGSAKLDIIAGSAFFTATDGSFVTARHVLGEMQPSPLRRPCNTPAIYIPRSGIWPSDGRFLDVKWFTFALNECAMSDAILDLARCKPHDDLWHDPEVRVPPTPVTIEAALPPEGTEVAFTGFPLQIPLPRTARANIAGYGSRDNSETSDMVIDRATWPGASGSPVFLANGHVIGVLLARGTSEATGMAFARTGNLLEKFLHSQ